MSKDPLQWIAAQGPLLAQQLSQWALINSGTYNLSGQQRMLNVLWQAFQALHSEPEILPLNPNREIDEMGELIKRPLGNALRFKKRPEAPKQILLVGHMDTVFGADHPFQSVQQLDHNTLQGPGIADMKGGLLIMLYALQALEQSEFCQNLGWEVLITPDEEIGSPSSAIYLQQSAQNKDFALVFEPALTVEGALASQRKGSGKFAIVVDGVAAHAGRAFGDGRNAIVGLAKLITLIDELNNRRPGVTINIGKIHGGRALNIVPDRAVCHIDVRISKSEDQDWVRQEFLKVLSKIKRLPGIHAEIYGEFGRPPKPLTPALIKFLDAVKSCGQELGQKIEFRSTGGCCDGNNLAAHGLLVVDSLGPCGGHSHSDQEFVFLPSLVERTQLCASILIKHAQGEFNYQ